MQVGDHSRVGSSAESIFSQSEVDHCHDSDVGILNIISEICTAVCCWDLGSLGPCVSDCEVDEIYFSSKL